MEQRFIDQLLLSERQRAQSTQNRHFIRDQLDHLIVSADDIFAPHEEVAINMHHLPSWYGTPQPNTHPMKPHKHSFFEFVYVYSGQFHSVVDSESLVLGQDQVILLNPNQIHAPYIERDSDLVLNLLIKQPLIDRAFASLISRDNILFDFFYNYIYGISGASNYLMVDRTPRVDRIMSSIVEEYCERRPLFEQSLIGWIINLFTELARVYSERKTNRPARPAKPEMAEIIVFIRENYATVTLSETAKTFSYSPSYLSYLIKKETGQTFKEIVRDFRIESACNFLKNTQLTLEQISEILGFQDGFYIAKVFKQRYGISPSEYRKRSRQQ